MSESPSATPYKYKKKFTPKAFHHSLRSITTWTSYLLGATTMTENEIRLWEHGVPPLPPYPWLSTFVLLLLVNTSEAIDPN